jgi:(4S)-4-hydroxy-5-phosphonooxypentane-2,3-dione isomerase
MPKLAILATIEVAPGRLEEYLPVVMAHRMRCLRDEPGTLQFEVLRPRDGDDNRLMLMEVYEDEAAFDAHWNAPSRAQHRAEAGDMILKVSGTKFTPLV